MRVTGVARLGRLIDAGEKLVLVGRRLNLTCFVEDADFLNARLRTDGSDDLIDLVAAVIEHSEARAALDDFRDAIAGSVGRFFQVLAMQTNDSVSQGRKSDYDSADETKSKF